MNRGQLKRAGKTWVEREIITQEQLNQLLSLYPKREPRLLLTIFAILLISIGFLTFVFSDWAQVPHFSRMLLIIFFMIGLYVTGHIFYEKNQEILGITLLLLGFVVFGAGLLLAINIYSIILFSAWPFVIWSIMAFILFVLYKHRWVFVVGVAVTTVGQINSLILYGSFNYFLIAILLIGFAHFVYHRKDRLYSYLVAVSFAIQAIVFINTYDQSYYWLTLYFLMLYIIGYLVKDFHISEPIQQIGLGSMFLLGMSQTFILNDIFLMNEAIEYSLLFFIVWLIVFASITSLKIFQENYDSLANLVLFLPVFYLPLASILSLLILFVFSLSWIIIGYARETYFKVYIGSIAFLLSTLTAYIQYAWDTLNKSLFFIVGGILLLVMSLIIERQRQLIREKSGDVR
ncbi:MAG TPA: DUF2157 domain-containing protein [Bacillota bacterium]|nr:DUF2157 domain-containing protein [Bacillota bacterium]